MTCLRTTRSTWTLAAAAAVLSVGALAAAPALASPVPSAPLAAPEDAAAYLVANLTDGDHYEGDFGPEYGPTIDIALGLIATESEPASVAAITAFATNEESVDGYLHGFDPAEIYASPTGKLGFYASIAGLDPRAVGGEDLVATLQELEANDGVYHDVSQYGDFANVFSQSFGILSLVAAESVEPSAAAVGALMRAQCDDGSFALTFGGGDCTGTADATGIAVQALNANDPGESETLSPEREAALVAAARWLEDARQSDGSYLLDDLVNINTTGYGGLGVYAAGLDGSPTTAYLASVQLDDGGLPINPGGESNVYATAQALPAMAADSFLSVAPDVVGPAVVVAPVEPTATPTSTSASPTSTPSVTASTLPPTGGSSSAVALVGLVALAVGGGIVLAARRVLAGS